MAQVDWYDTRRGKAFFWGVLGVTLLGVVASVTVTGMQIPWVVYLFGFLGATVYAFTSFASRFDEAGRYRLKIVSRTVAVLPLAAGVYLLAFAFTGASGELSALEATGADGTEVNAADRAVAGLVFLVGIYVSATLQALGGLAERLLGLTSDRPGSDGETERPSDSGNGNGNANGGVDDGGGERRGA